jgi:hypothetical protein
MIRSARLRRLLVSPRTHGLASNNFSVTILTYETILRPKFWKNPYFQTFLVKNRHFNSIFDQEKVKISIQNILHFCIFLQLSFQDQKNIKNNISRWCGSLFFVTIGRLWDFILPWSKKLIGLFLRKISCKLRIWFLFWAFYTKNSRHGYFFKKWAEFFTFLKISNCWFFPPITHLYWRFEIKNSKMRWIVLAVGDMDTDKHAKKCHFPIIL